MPERKPEVFDHEWFWRVRPLGHAHGLFTMLRKGQRCRVLRRGAKDTILVEFSDGYKLTTSRYAVRRIKE